MSTPTPAPREAEPPFPEGWKSAAVAPAPAQYVLQLLVAAGHVSQAKVDEAFSIAKGVHPDAAPKASGQADSPDYCAGFVAGQRYAEASGQPTVQAMSDERGAFERWADDQGFPLRRLDIGDGDDYHDARTQSVWDAWQARSILSAAIQPAQQEPTK